MEEMHGLAQRVDGAAVAQVAHHVDVQVLQRALCLLDGIQVQERLRRVLIGTVAGIHHRNARHRSGDIGRTGHRVTHDDQIYIIGNDADGVFQRLALALGSVAIVREADDLGAEAAHGRFKRQAGTGRGLEKEAGHHLAAQEILFAGGFELPGHREDVKDFFLAEILDGDEVFGHVTYSLYKVQSSIWAMRSRKSSSRESRTRTCRRQRSPKSCPCCGRSRSFTTFITGFMDR